MLPDMDAISTMLPPLPYRRICWPAACAVYSTPLVLTSSTFNRVRHYFFDICKDMVLLLTALNCSAGYVKQSV